METPEWITMLVKDIIRPGTFHRTDGEPDPDGRGDCPEPDIERRFKPDNNRP